MSLFDLTTGIQTTQPAPPPPAAPGVPLAAPPPERPALSPEVRRVKALRRFAVAITALNALGHLFLGFEQAPLTPVLSVLVGYASAVLFERLDAWAHGRSPEYAGGFGNLVTFLLPAHITALACAMLLYGNDTFAPYLFAVVAGTASKYLVRLRIRGKLRHVLNPSNFGIAITLLIFPWVGIAPPYHFTNATSSVVDWLLPLVILMLGTLLNAKLTGKMPLILGWVGGFGAQAVLRGLILDHNVVAALLPMTGLSFIVFTNYMITDPGTTPIPALNQVAFGVGTAAVYAVLVVSGVSFGLFFALVIMCALRGLFLAVRSWMPPNPVAQTPAVGDRS